MKTLKILGLLLTYPQKEMVDACQEMKDVLENENFLPKKYLNPVYDLIDYLQDTNIWDLQEEYVSLFDRSPSLSLHLFEHVHGESRDRGAALVELGSLYQEQGLEISGKETPDYLPMFLEFISQLPLDAAQEYLENAINVIATVGVRLEKRKSPYVSVFKALEAATNAKADEKVVENALKEKSGEEQTFDEVDEEWEEQFAWEQPVTSDDGCPKMNNILSEINKGLKEPNDKEARQ